MSLKQYKNALVEGMYPTFPDEIRMLSEIFGNTTHISSIEITYIGEGFNESFIEVKKVTSSDDYGWHSALCFKINGKIMIIAFPYLTDDQLLDDSRCDRSCAIYAETGINQDKMKAFLVSVCRLIEQWYVPQRA